MLLLLQLQPAAGLDPSPLEIRASVARLVWIIPDVFISLMLALLYLDKFWWNDSPVCGSMNGRLSAREAWLPEHFKELIDFYNMVAGKRLYLSELCYLNLINITRGFQYCEVHLLHRAERSQCSKQNVNMRRGICLCLWQLLRSSRMEGSRMGSDISVCLSLCQLEWSVTG